MKKFIFLILFSISLGINAQNLVISDDSAYSGSSNALFEVYSANGNKGILIPRLTTTQRTSIATTGIDEGLVVYDTDTHSFWVWDGTQWTELGDKQTLSFNNSTGELTISNGNTVTIPLSSGGDNWGSQVVQTDGTTLSGDGTSTYPLSVVGDLTDNQQLSLSGHDLSIENGNTITLPDNDNQTLGLSGNTLSITNGNSVDLSSINTDDQTLSISGHTISIENGNSVIVPDNDNQTLSLSGNTLSISGGNSVNISSSAWSLTGNSISSSNFLGTTNDEPLNFKVNNEVAGKIYSDNTSIGYGTFHNLTSGTRNALFGENSGYNVTSGSNNVYVGDRAGYCYQTGESNTAVGYQALYGYGFASGSPVAGGSYNVAVGRYAMFNAQSGDKNVAIGYFAGSYFNNDNENTFIGYGADLASTSTDVTGAIALGARSSSNADYATAIGYKAYANQANSLILGQTTNDGNPNNATANTNVGINTLSPETAANLTLGAMDDSHEGGQITWYGAGSYDTWRTDLYDNDYRIFSNSSNNNSVQIFNNGSGVTDLRLNGGTGYATGGWQTTSDGRIKTNLKELPYGLSDIMKLKPLEYDKKIVKELKNGQFKYGKTIHSIGFIAQDVYKIIPYVVHKPKDEQNELWSIDYSKLSPVLVKAIQELKQQNDLQQKEISELKKEIEELKSNKN